MKKEEATPEKDSEKKRGGWTRTIGLILNGKFFPRRFFENYWGILLTLVALFLSSIAHRNMYMLQLNKIQKLETTLIDCTTERILLEYERDENLRLHDITESVERCGLPLVHSPEPKKEIVVKPVNDVVEDEE